MKRQLYYLIPDVKHVQKVCEDLQQLAIPQTSLHAVMNEKSEIGGVKDIHSLQEADRDYLLEWFLWRMNLALFVIALLAAIGMAIWMPSIYILIPAGVMLVTLSAGIYFSMRIPNVHWNEFSSALHHGEVLLIVDAPESRLRNIDHTIHRQHPEVLNGGVCWKV